MSFPVAAGLTVMTNSAATFAVGATVGRADIPGLCAGLAGLLRGRAGGIVTCDVTAARADVVTVEALARLELTARRHGWQLVVDGAGPELLRLVVLVGLAGVLELNVGRQAEQREQAGRVEEAVDRGDPPG